jgi:hypothetical protein
MTMSYVTRRRAPLYIHALHQVQQRIRRSKWRRRLAAWIAATRPRANHQGEIDDVVALNTDGFTILADLVDHAWVERVRAALEQRQCLDRWRPELGYFVHNEIPPQTHVADINDIIDIPEVLEVANHPRVIGSVSSYFGCMPTIDSIKAWWSLPGHDHAENEQCYHRDNDSIRFLKLFIYLTDVDKDCGPHVFVRHTHNRDGCLERRRYRDEEVETEFGVENIRHFTGPAGTAFLEDTYGVHKGQLPVHGKRLLLQIRYTVVPSIFMSRRRRAQPETFASYTNRLI